MNSWSLVISVLAAGALAAGSLGMAQASPHAIGEHHDAHAVGLIGEDPTLEGSTDRQRSVPRLRGKVNDDRDLTLSSRNLPPGRYKIIIRDSTKRHSWHIFGNGVDKKTTGRGTGRWASKVRLRSGTYTVVCDPHVKNMRFTVTVG